MRNIFQITILSVLAIFISKTPVSYASEQTHTSKQHYVMVHGAWHGAWAWYKVETLLEKAGHQVTTLDLPAHGIDTTPPSIVTLQDYASKVINVINQSNKPVILVGHSMGGIVLSTVAEAIPNKIAKLVYLAAFLLPNGKTLVDVASQDAESLVTPNLIINPEAGFIDVNRSLLKEMFYAKSPKSDVTLAEKLVRVNPFLPFVTPMNITEQNFGSVRRFYISALQDRAISASVQESMYTALPCEKVYRINTDHSPFFSKPVQLVHDLLDIARR